MSEDRFRTAVRSVIDGGFKAGTEAAVKEVEKAAKNVYGPTTRAAICKEIAAAIRALSPVRKEGE